MAVPIADNSLLVGGQYFISLLGEDDKHIPFTQRLEMMGERFAILYGCVYDTAQGRFISMPQAKIETACEQYGYKPNLKEDAIGESWKIFPLWDAYLKYYARPKYDGVVFNPGLMGSKLDHAGSFNLAHAPFANACDATFANGEVPAYEDFLAAYFKNNIDLVEVWHNYMHELLFKPMIKSLEWHISCPDAMLAQLLANVIREVASPYCADVHPMMSLAQKQEACLGKLVVIDTRIAGNRKLAGEVFYNWAQQSVCSFNPKHGVPLVLNNFLRVFGVHLDSKSLPDVSRLRCVYEIGNVTNKLAGAKADFEQWTSSHTDWGRELYLFYKNRKYGGSSVSCWFESMNG